MTAAMPSKMAVREESTPVSRLSSILGSMIQALTEEDALNTAYNRCGHSAYRVRKAREHAWKPYVPGKPRASLVKRPPTMTSTYLLYMI